MVSEESHLKNLATFELAIEIIEKSGKNYESVNPEMSISKLKEKATNYKISINNKMESNSIFRKTIDGRQELKIELQNKLKQISNSLNIYPLPEKAMDRFMTLKKISRGERLTDSSVEKEKQHSASHTGQYSKVALFNEVLALLEINHYQAARTDIQLENLKSFGQILEVANQQWHINEKNNHEKMLIRNENYEIVKLNLVKLKQVVIAVEPEGSNIISLLKDLYIK